ncbi:MAG TPA: hypothetical protein VGF24_18310 [Vicinamibacterales bacterium]
MPYAPAQPHAPVETQIRGDGILDDQYAKAEAHPMSGTPELSVDEIARVIGGHEIDHHGDRVIGFDIDARRKMPSFGNRHSTAIDLVIDVRPHFTD